MPIRQRMLWFCQFPGSHLPAVLATMHLIEKGSNTFCPHTCLTPNPMKPKPNSTLRTIAAGAGLWLCSAALLSAGTIVTFQVDMSNANFDPASQTVSARGAFAGPGTTWGELPLTNNPSGPNPGLWSGTTNLPFTQGVLSYKYSIEPGILYETVAMGGSHNRLALMPGTDGATLVLPKAYYADTPPVLSDITVTFQVNLAQQINVGAFDVLASSVYTKGMFNGWGQDYAMTNDPSILTTNTDGLVTSNVYVMTYVVTGSPGQTLDFKFFIDKNNNWESLPASVGDPADNNNRFFNLSDSSTTQVVGPLYFNELPYAPAFTNDVTFQVDMTAQVLNGNFDPSTGTVELRGNFNGWGTPQILCTNDLNAANTNLYSTVVKISDSPAATEQYKFWASVPVNSGWETMANNRTFSLVNGSSQTMPVAFFSNVKPSDLLSADTVVTFKVDLSAAVTTDGQHFNPASDQLYINGLPAGTFVTWDTSLPQLTNNPPGSGTYSIDMLIPKGSPLQQTYKYGINGADNEAGTGTNHVRYIRSPGTYAMPLDTFGAMVSEPAVGSLQIGAPAGDHVLVSWQGAPGLQLQTRSDLTTGSWINHPETAGLSSTNWPVSGQALFFRLIQP